MITRPDIAEKLTRARAALILDQPFFGALSLRLKLVEDSVVPTLSTNGKEIRYNPEYVASLSINLTKSALAHEVMHPVLDHLSRLQGREPQRWNQAADYALNPLIKDAGFELAPEWLNSPAFAGMSADAIYNQLPPMPPDGSGNGHGPAQDEIEPSGASEAEQSEQAQEWRVATIQAASAAKAMGKLPGDLERFLDRLLNNKVDWKAVLRRFLTQAAKADYVWTRPNRKMLAAQGIYMPSLYSEAMGEIVIAVDTSGSIDDAMLNTFGAEVEAIAAEMRPEKVHVIYCDSQIAHVDEFNGDDQIVLKAHGGGGTDFRPPFAYIEERGLQPVALVYLTDGYGPFPEHPAEFPTLWTITTDVEAPHGETVRLEI